MSCGKTIGHGETCQPDYLCGECERIAELEKDLGIAHRILKHGVQTAEEAAYIFDLPSDKEMNNEF